MLIKGVNCEQVDSMLCENEELCIVLCSVM